MDAWRWDRVGVLKTQWFLVLGFYLSFIDAFPKVLMEYVFFIVLPK